MGTKKLMFGTILLPSIILAVSAFEDIRTKRVTNKLLLSLFAVVFIVQLLVLKQFEFAESISGVVTAFLLLSPLFLLKALGAADIKVFMLLGFLTGPYQILNIFIFSLVCAVIFGFAIVVQKKGSAVFFQNIKNILTFKKDQVSNLQHIPFTVALLAGWICYLVYQYHGRII